MVPYKMDQRNAIFCSVCGLLIQTSSPVVVSNKAIEMPKGRASTSGSRKINKVCTRHNVKKGNEVSQIHSNNFEKIPRGKLIYLKHNNSFIRYFNDEEINTFVKCLKITEKRQRRLLAKQLSWKEGKVIKGKPKVNKNLDLPKCVRGKCEMVKVYQPEALEFSNRRKFGCWEDYSLEWNKVMNAVPKDFGEFYVYVAELQRIQGHRPITFLYFLRAYNTDNLDEFLIKYCYGN